MFKLQQQPLTNDSVITQWQQRSLKLQVSHRESGAENKSSGLSGWIYICHANDLPIDLQFGFMAFGQSKIVLRFHSFFIRGLGNSHFAYTLKHAASEIQSRFQPKYFVVVALNLHGQQILLLRSNSGLTS